MMRLSPFYPIVPDVTWLRRLLPLGVGTVQLRIKDTAQDAARRQIAEAVQLTRGSACQLIINDDWQAAIDCAAGFVHLGQEDLAGVPGEVYAAHSPTPISATKSLVSPQSK